MSIERFNDRAPAPITQGLSLRDQRRTARSLAQLEARTTVRMAAVDCEAVVSAEKVKGIASVTRTAVTEYTMVKKFADTVSMADPFLTDDLRLITDTARLSMASTIVDLSSNYAREARR